MAGGSTSTGQTTDTKTMNAKNAIDLVDLDEYQVADLEVIGADKRELVGKSDVLSLHALKIAQYVLS